MTDLNRVLRKGPDTPDVTSGYIMLRVKMANPATATPGEASEALIPRIEVALNAYLASISSSDTWQSKLGKLRLLRLTAEAGSDCTIRTAGFEERYNAQEGNPPANPAATVDVGIGLASVQQLEFHWDALPVDDTLKFRHGNTLVDPPVVELFYEP